MKAIIVAKLTPFYTLLRFLFINVCFFACLFLFFPLMKYTSVFKLTFLKTGQLVERPRLRWSNDLVPSFGRLQKHVQIIEEALSPS